MEQGTEEWFSARLGKVTASRVGDMTARTKTGWGASRANYLADLITERLTGRPTEKFQSPEMRRGSEVEPAARAAYAFERMTPIVEVGFVLHPTIGDAGASPDGLVGDDGLVEIKCPNTATHLDTLLGAAIDVRYVKQMQWQMACTGRQWCDFVSFDNRLPEPMQLHVRRVERDTALIRELETEAVEFLDEIRNKVRELRRRYMPETVAPAPDLLMAG